MTKLQPLADRLLVQLDPRASESKGGILIPQRSQAAEQWGTVAAAGPTAAHCQPGDRVFVPPHLGTHYIEDGQDYILIEEARVVCREEREWEERRQKLAIVEGEEGQA